MPFDTKQRFKKSNTMKLIELKYNSDDIVELLKTEYLDNGCSILNLATKWDVSPCTIHKWLVMWDVPRRHLTFS